MTRWMLMLAVLLLLLVSLGCGRRASHGFKLPPGDPVAGQVAFANLGCANCHTVDGVQLPTPTAVPAVPLGGPKAVFPTIGELTTDIIFPSDRTMTRTVSTGGGIVHPPMPDLADRMTVRQMADLVTFLQGHYQYAPVPAVYK